MARVLRQRQEEQVVCVCCVCGEARDDIAGDGAWYGLKAHLSRYGLQEQDLMFSHTFCPWCLMHYKNLLGLEHMRCSGPTTGSGGRSITTSRRG
jgi:hypothetical protein